MMVGLTRRILWPCLLSENTKTAFLNSTFDEGDWNGDGDFDSRDFVFAFRAGTYGRDAELAAVAAAIDGSGQDSDVERRRNALDGSESAAQPTGWIQFAFVP